MVYKDSSQGGQFVTEINKLRAHDGGDCPELTFKGILDAMSFSPLPGSPLYVFTDASAKDGTPENIAEAVTFAQAMGLTINFFTTGLRLCGTSSYKPFEDLARATCGQMLYLPSSSELKDFSSITGISLTGATCLCGGGHDNSSGKKKRSITTEYTIPVDDSIEKIIVTVTTENMGHKITLKDPLRHVVSSGKITFPRGALYEINHPRP